MAEFVTFRLSTFQTNFLGFVSWVFQSYLKNMVVICSSAPVMGVVTGLICKLLISISPIAKLDVVLRSDLNYCQATAGLLSSHQQLPMITKCKSHS